MVDMTRSRSAEAVVQADENVARCARPVPCMKLPASPFALSGWSWQKQSPRH